MKKNYLITYTRPPKVNDTLNVSAENILDAICKAIKHFDNSNFIITKVEYVSNILE